MFCNSLFTVEAIIQRDMQITVVSDHAVTTRSV